MAGMVTIEFLSESPTFKENLNQISSVSLLKTTSTALTSKGLFELTLRPWLTWAVSLSFAETTKEPGCSLVKRPKLSVNLVTQ